MVQSLNDNLPSISVQNNKPEDSELVMKMNSVNASRLNNNSKLNTTKQTEATKETFLSKNLSRNSSKVLYGNEGMLRARSYNN